MIGKAFLERARARTEERFSETVEIGTFEDGYDRPTGKATRVLVDEQYKGPGQLVYASLTVSDRDSGSQDLAEQTPVLKLPSGTVLTRDAEVHITASDASDALVGQKYTVDGQPEDGQTTAARYPLKILT